MRDSWTVRLSVGILLATLFSAPLAFARLEPLVGYAAAVGLVAGVGMGLLGRYPLSYVALGACVTAACAAAAVLLTRSFAAVAILYLAGGILDLALLQFVRFKDDFALPLLLVGAVALTGVMVLSFRAFEWGWYGAPVYVALIPFVVLPGALLFDRAGVRLTKAST